MKVKELIAKLQELDQELVVTTYHLYRDQYKEVIRTPVINKLRKPPYEYINDDGDFIEVTNFVVIIR